MCRARRGGPRTPSRPTYANLDCAFVENALIFVVLKIGRARAPLGKPFTTTLIAIYTKKVYNIQCVPKLKMGGCCESLAAGRPKFPKKKGGNENAFFCGKLVNRMNYCVVAV